jgi:proteasome beta subunit
VPLSFDEHGSSFYDFLVGRGPSSPSPVPPLPVPASGSGTPAYAGLPLLPHGTTVLAIRFQDGVLIAGDRQATEGFQVSGRRIEKVFKTDAHSAVAIAGAAGPAIELARLFQIELEHYEKLEGEVLSCEGKANKLGQMVRGNLPMAFQGLVVIPLFAGYDLKRREGRIFKYDVTGGRYEETEYHATGSGGKDARDTMKQLYRRGLAEAQALRIALESLFNASEDDVGTGGPDLIRGIYPTVKVITEGGVRDLEDPKIGEACTALIAERREKA